MRGTSYWDDLKHLQSSKIGQAARSRRPGSPTATRLWPREGGLQNTKRLNSNLSSPRASGHRSSFRGAKSEARAPLSSLFHVFFGKFPPLRGLFTNLRESIKEAKSINQPDAKPGIKKPRPNPAGSADIVMGYFCFSLGTVRQCGCSRVSHSSQPRAAEC